MNSFFKEHLDVLRVMINEDVEFMIIGGYAVIYHGYQRTTGDMDIWIKPDNDNKVKLIDALRKAGFDDEGLVEMNERDFTKHFVFHLNTEPEIIEFITRIAVVNFDDAKKKIQFLQADDVAIPFINLDDLILSKISTGRMKDKADVEQLQFLRRNRGI